MPSSPLLITSRIIWPDRLAIIIELAIIRITKHAADILPFVLTQPNNAIKI